MYRRDNGLRRAACAVGVMLALTAAPICAEDAPSLLQFMGERSARGYTQVPRRVLAFYYTWYGTPDNGGGWVHWKDPDYERHDIANCEHWPLIGPYDSQDPELVDLHIEQAQRSGVDGFIATWWGRGAFSDEAFEVLVDRADRAGFEVTVYWETAPGSGQEQIEGAVEDLSYILRRYGDRSSFLKMDGRPVVFVYGRVMGQVPMSAWPAIIEGAREAYGGDFLLIADGYRDSYARVFDGVHTYNICGQVPEKSVEEIREDVGDSYASAVGLARSNAKISCVTVIPGYDDTKIREPGLIAARHDGRTYAALWEEAIEADPDWVLVTSWNEWHEGSEIEPSLENGPRDLRITDRYAHRFSAQAPVEVDGPQRAAIPPRRQEELRRLYDGRTLGMLPGYGGSLPLMLVDSGLEVRELSWEDVVEPGVLSAEALPVVIFAGSEHYRRTVHAQGDVDDALLRYLREGGILMVAGTHPLPFYYAEEGPVNRAQALGLPVQGSAAAEEALTATEPVGWEEPPRTEGLRFQIDTEALPTLAEVVAFPGGGDLRWRPASEALVVEGDRYLPLATLTDVEGRRFGEGMAWVERRVSEPVGGRLLYSWMRMDDIVRPGALYYELLRFVGQRLDER